MTVIMYCIKYSKLRLCSFMYRCMWLQCVERPVVCACYRAIKSQEHSTVETQDSHDAYSVNVKGCTRHTTSVNVKGCTNHTTSVNVKDGREQ